MSLLNVSDDKRLVILDEHTRGDIPARGERKEVSKRRGEIAGFRCKHTENRWINVVHRDGTNIDKLG